VSRRSTVGLLLNEYAKNIASISQKENNIAF